MTSKEQLEQKLYTGVEAPFETFRRVSQVHFKTLHRVLKLIEEVKKMDNPIRVLDLGAGDSTFAEMVIEGLKNDNFSIPIEFTWIDSNQKYCEKLEALKQKLPENFTATVIKENIQDCIPSEGSFDLIFFNHVLYYLKPDEQITAYSNMINALTPEGKLFIEARTKGDTDDKFINVFHKRANGKPPPDRTIETALKALTEIRKQGILTNFKIEYHEHETDMVYPLDPSHPDFSNLIQFHLLHSWEDLVKDIKDITDDERINLRIQLQQDILQFIRERNGIFLEREGDIIVTKK